MAFKAKASRQPNRRRRFMRTRSRNYRPQLVRARRGVERKQRWTRLPLKGYRRANSDIPRPPITASNRQSFQRAIHRDLSSHRKIPPRVAGKNSSPQIWDMERCKNTAMEMGTLETRMGVGRLDRPFWLAASVRGFVGSEGAGGLANPAVAMPLRSPVGESCAGRCRWRADQRRRTQAGRRRGVA
jgi:hypothetical protein